MTYQVSVLRFRTIVGDPVPWAIFVRPYPARTPRGTRHECIFNPKDNEWQYSYTRDYSIVRDLEEKAILGKIDDLSAFEEIMKEAPLPIEARMIRVGFCGLLKRRLIWNCWRQTLGIFWGGYQKLKQVRVCQRFLGSVIFNSSLSVKSWKLTCPAVDQVLQS